MFFIPRDLLDKLKGIVKKGEFKSVSELINQIIKECPQLNVEPKIKRQFSLDIESVKILESKSFEHFNGNNSEALIFIVKQYLEQQRNDID